MTELCSFSRNWDFSSFLNNGGGLNNGPMYVQLLEVHCKMLTNDLQIQGKEIGQLQKVTTILKSSDGSNLEQKITTILIIRLPQTEINCKIDQLAVINIYFGSFVI